MKSHKEALSENVRRLRESRGLSLSQLSEQSGIAKATLFKIERGDSNPTLDTVVTIAATFDVAVESLIAVPPSLEVEVIRDGDGQDISDDSSAGAILRRQVIGAGTLEIHVQEFHKDTNGTSAPHGAGSREHVYVFDGKIEVGPISHEVILGVGDYATYPADHVHRWRPIDGDASVLIFHTFPRAIPFSE
ncbi:MAG: helix-turn-helix domain-containing protein [Gulosibacter sp.]|uniref:helix-turn-helix domain-containing protein n=1 Tax=Gulosibacter sp. TaxID=2817531 RepID=UPI003F92FDBE